MPRSIDLFTKATQLVMKLNCSFDLEHCLVKCCGSVLQKLQIVTRYSDC